MYKILRERGRKLNRLSQYDYSRNGWYFITVCTWQKKNYFGEIQNGKMKLSQMGKIVDNIWYTLPKHYPCLLDYYITMPNHIHGIIIINNTIGNACMRSLRIKMPLSKMIHGFKSATTREIHKKNLGYFRWQKSFYDHIIRDDFDLTRIREYIQNNPKNWEKDEENI